MSSVYVLEPPTRGKVIVNTSVGPLDIELWSKEAPKACRNFVQLCMEGYYDRTIFHRIISGFIVQGGDPTGTGNGGESIYGEPFDDEIHTRLKFRQRGFVACANANEKNSNGSQFFITLDRADGLNGKHTIFGKITGDTIYNLLKLGGFETDKDDRPLEPPRIVSTEILWNPFDDIVPRKLKRPEPAPPQAQETQPQVKQKKKLNLLSFGEEALQEEEEVKVANKKIKSSHDVLDDPRLLKSSETVTLDARHGEEERKVEEEERQRKQEEEKRRKELQTSVRQALAPKQTKKDDDVPDDDVDEMSFDKKMREEILEKRKLLGKTSDRPPKPPKSNEKEDDDGEEDGKDEHEEGDRVIRDKLVIKKKGLGSEGRAELALQRNADMQLLTPLQQQREKYKQRKRNLQGREETTIELLNKFKEQLEQDKELLNHKLEFPMEEKKKRIDDVDQYVVQDPLLERGKEKFNKMQAKMKKRNREWAGRSLT